VLLVAGLWLGLELQLFLVSGW